jgi:hypothetical protein
MCQDCAVGIHTKHRAEHIHVAKGRKMVHTLGQAPDVKSAYNITPDGIYAATVFEVLYTAFTAGNADYDRKMGQVLVVCCPHWVHAAPAWCMNTDGG